MNESKQGYLYVLANSSMPGLVKVGRTTRLPSERADELAGVTGVPTPFIIVLEQLFTDCEAAELFVHTQLERNGYRVAKNREFFRAPVNEVVRLIVSTPGTLSETTEENSPYAQTDSDEADLLSNDMPDELAGFMLHNDQSPNPWDSVLEEAVNFYYGIGDYLQDFEEAFKLYKDAARLGSSVALERIGEMYRLGQGVSRNYQKALDFYKEAVKKGNYYGHALMGEVFFTQCQFENAQKCYKAFFRTRAQGQDPLVEKDPSQQKFANACFGYISSSLMFEIPMDFVDYLIPITQELVEVTSITVESSRGTDIFPHFEKVLLWIQDLHAGRGDHPHRPEIHPEQTGPGFIRRLFRFFRSY
jgi:tetratricopeptide (TPR) repeat protein